MGPIGVAPGAARLCLVDGVSLLRPEDQVFAAMLAGFANQQLARNLARAEHFVGGGRAGPWFVSAGQVAGLRWSPSWGQRKDGRHA